MSTYVERFNATTGDTYNRSTVDPEFRGEYPALADVFGGCDQDAAVGKTIPCATINLFWEGGRLKFCIIPKGYNQVAFGTVGDPSKGFAAIEAAIQAGHFEWKRKMSR